jgi:hypothetical protein
MGNPWWSLTLWSLVKRLCGWQIVRGSVKPACRHLALGQVPSTRPSRLGMRSHLPVGGPFRHTTLHTWTVVLDFLLIRTTSASEVLDPMHICGSGDRWLVAVDDRSPSWGRWELHCTPGRLANRGEFRTLWSVFLSTCADGEWLKTRHSDVGILTPTRAASEFWLLGVWAKRFIIDRRTCKVLPVVLRIPEFCSTCLVVQRRSECFAVIFHPSLLSGDHP